MKKNKPIILVVVSDNHLVVMLSALLKSIEVSHSQCESIIIYIVNDGIRTDNIKKINDTVSSKNISIRWVKMGDAIPTHIKLPHDDTSFPTCAYARICAPYFLPENVERAIYLDVDMLVMKNLRELWEIDMKGCIIGAVVDRCQTVGSSWGGIKNYHALGLDADAKYFNSGLMVIDIEKWKKSKITELLVDTANRNSKYISFADQYALNVVFYRTWYELPLKWNCYAQNDFTDPHIIHFTGIKPIFSNYGGNADYKSHFFAILDITPWAGFRPKSGVLRLSKKLHNLVFKKIKKILKPN